MYNNHYYLELCNIAAIILSNIIQGRKALGELAAIINSIKSM